MPANHGPWLGDGAMMKRKDHVPLEPEGLTMRAEHFGVYRSAQSRKQRKSPLRACCRNMGGVAAVLSFEFPFGGAIPGQGCSLLAIQSINATG
jgi:hypothetical protein